MNLIDTGPSIFGIYHPPRRSKQLLPPAIRGHALHGNFPATAGRFEIVAARYGAATKQEAEGFR